MAVASVVEGQIADRVDTTSASKQAGGSSMDKEAFLQLLVAQMKYQDPLEPTSNTEYIAQYATFSQVEMLQNMSATMDTSAAMQLVGKTVTIESETASGTKTQTTGVVDYVERSGNKNMLYIDGVPYNYDNLVTVWSDDYMKPKAEAPSDDVTASEAAQETAGADDADGAAGQTAGAAGNGQSEETADSPQESLAPDGGSASATEAAQEAGQPAGETDASPDAAADSQAAAGEAAGGMAAQAEKADTPVLPDESLQTAVQDV